MDAPVGWAHLSACAKRASKLGEQMLPLGQVR